MGASAWLTIVTHDPDDLAGALAAAHAQVLRSGAFYDAFGVTADTDAAKAHFQASLTLPDDFPEPDRSEILAHLQEDLAWRVGAVDRYAAATSDAERVAALRDASAEEGTHSVMDVTLAQLTPAPSAAVTRAYGRDVPDAAVVRARPDALLTLVSSRGAGVWFRVHDHGAPAVAFVGVSGD